ncbi:uncharacterized protein AB675_9811 [Cyphellophora attinorum]|uniref:Uncharacterized protein n=1 Tax=Cyphellophora attinorum TaxID=1664694 RepID=A0A0N0NPC5_9EURO|nr:uncharacterized protein AB675_9811 [Phialophora attinorum]KPI42591.1 hypothetical protein AB675_9811 [Phialophora attinorum]
MPFSIKFRDSSMPSKFGSRKKTARVGQDVHPVDMAYNTAQKKTPFVMRALQPFKNLGSKCRGKQLVQQSASTVNRNATVEDSEDEEECNAFADSSFDNVTAIAPIHFENITIIDNIDTDTHIKPCTALIIAPRSEMKLVTALLGKILLVNHSLATEQDSIGLKYMLLKEEYKVQQKFTESLERELLKLQSQQQYTPKQINFVKNKLHTLQQALADEKRKHKATSSKLAKWQASHAIIDNLFEEEKRSNLGVYESMSNALNTVHNNLEKTVGEKDKLADSLAFLWNKFNAEQHDCAQWKHAAELEAEQNEQKDALIHSLRLTTNDLRNERDEAKTEVKYALQYAQYWREKYEAEIGKEAIAEDSPSPDTETNDVSTRLSEVALDEEGAEYDDSDAIDDNASDEDNVGSGELAVVPVGGQTLEEWRAAFHMLTTPGSPRLKRDDDESSDMYGDWPPTETNEVLDEEASQVSLPATPILGPIGASASVDEDLSPLEDEVEDVTATHVLSDVGPESSDDDFAPPGIDDVTIAIDAATTTDIVSSQASTSRKKRKADETEEELIDLETTGESDGNDGDEVETIIINTEAEVDEIELPPSAGLEDVCDTTEPALSTDSEGYAATLSAPLASADALEEVQDGNATPLFGTSDFNFLFDSGDNNPFVPFATKERASTNASAHEASNTFSFSQQGTRAFSFGDMALADASFTFTAPSTVGTTGFSMLPESETEEEIEMAGSPDTPEEVKGQIMTATGDVAEANSSDGSTEDSKLTESTENQSENGDEPEPEPEPKAKVVKRVAVICMKAGGMRIKKGRKPKN